MLRPRVLRVTSRWQHVPRPERVRCRGAGTWGRPRRCGCRETFRERCSPSRSTRCASRVGPVTEPVAVTVRGRHHTAQCSEKTGPDPIRPKIFFRKYFSENIFPKIFFRKYFSENIFPKIFFRKYFSENIFPKIFFRKYFSENIFPKLFFQKYFSKNVLPKKFPQNICI